MDQGVYAVYDKKMESFMSPFVSFTDAMAKRSFTDLAKDPGHPVAQHPEDYALYRVGTWSPVPGTLKAPRAPIPLLEAGFLTRDPPIVPMSVAEAAKAAAREKSAIEEALEEVVRVRDEIAGESSNG